MSFKHENSRLKEFFEEKNSSGRILRTSSARAAAYSAVDEWHRSPKTPSNFAHFRMCLSGAGVPDKMVDAVTEEERAAT